MAGALAGCSEPTQNNTGQSSAGIIGGTTTLDLPAIGQLVFNQGTNVESRCTGTLIANNVVLTAAHCVKYLSCLQTTPSCIVGDFVISESDASGQVIKHLYATRRYTSLISSGSCPGGWEGCPSDEDLALVELEEPVPAQVAAPLAVSRRQPNPGDVVKAYGYGCTSWGSSSSGDKRVVSSTVAGLVSAQTTTACVGDSGGPLIDGHGKIVLVISGSWAHMSLAAKVGRDVFANPVNHLSWIQTQWFT